MLRYATPGVYFEQEQDRGRRLYEYRTDIAGFVGITERGPLFEPVRIDSWEQYLSTFGAHIAHGYLAYAVEGFFANGGVRCWVVRVADSNTAQAARVPLSQGLHLHATSPGIWGSRIDLTLRVESTGRFSLSLRTARGERETWRNLSLVPWRIESGQRAELNPRYIKRVLNDSTTGSRLVDVDDGLTGDEEWPPGFNGFSLPLERITFFRMNDGRDGLRELTVAHIQRGLATLEDIDEVSIVAIPDIMPKPFVKAKSKKTFPSDCSVLTEEATFPETPVIEPEFPEPFEIEEINLLQNALIAHCVKLQDRVAILDIGEGVRDPEKAIEWRRQFDTKYAALYYPWIAVPDPKRLTGLLREVPPSGHIAGLYARGDRTIGVHKPPANEEIQAVQDVVVATHDESHGLLNENHVNVVRTYDGRGIRIGGARTLSSDPEWRFVNVRRLLIMIEERLDEGLQWTVFEPNDRALWGDIEQIIREFLRRLWRQGMLDGATQEQAFHVKCDETTNPQSEVDQGRLLCEVGVNPPWPAEFVVVRIGITDGGTEIIEETGAQRA